MRPGLLFLTSSIFSLLISPALPSTCEKETALPSSPPISIDIPSEARLYASPGSTHSVLLEVTNHGDGDEEEEKGGGEEKVLLVSHRENFYNPKRKHVQLVSEVSPTTLENLGPNETATVELTFKIPPYVELGVQTKVALVIERRLSGVMFERAFYFTVSEGNLSSFDAVRPECLEVTYCGRESCAALATGKGGRTAAAAAAAAREDDDCAESFWSATVTGVDGVTGLRGAETDVDVGVFAQQPQSDFVVGSTKPAQFRFLAECCTRGFEVELSDVAGNTATCVVGVVASAGMAIETSVTFVTAVAYAVLLALASRL